MGFGDEDWKRWEMDVQRTCIGEVLQAWVRMEINALAKHLLPANTSETSASKYLAGAEPPFRRHLTATAFAQVAKVGGAEQMPSLEINFRGNLTTQTEKCLFAFQSSKPCTHRNPPMLQEY